MNRHENDDKQIMKWLILIGLVVAGLVVLTVFTRAGGECDVILEIPRGAGRTTSVPTFYNQGESETLLLRGCPDGSVRWEIAKTPAQEMKR